MHIKRSLPPANRVLTAGATGWFVTATIGQWAFVVFILLFFGGTLAGDVVPADHVLEASGAAAHQRERERAGRGEGLGR